MHNSNYSRLTMLWILSTLVWTVCMMSACLESSVECTSDGACAEGLVCVNTQCVDTEVVGDSYQVYKEEMHLRLVSQCGICHGIRGENPPLVTTTPLPAMDMGMTMEVMPEMEAVEDPCAPNLEPLYIPKLPVTLGDSGWRIFLDDLSEERLRASYEDTMQYINVEKPEDSLLLAYGRGEIYITGVYGGKKGRLHPRVYPSALGDACTLEALPMANINETDMNLMGTDMGMEDTMEEKALSKSEIVYQRMSSWAALSHKYFTGIGLFNLEVYQNNAQALIEGSCFCHGKETEGTAIEPSFEFMRGSLEEASGVASLAPLINPNQPEKSALIRMAFEEYEHPPIGALPDYEQAMLSWIEKL